MSLPGGDLFRRRRRSVARRRWWPWAVGAAFLVVLGAGAWAVGWSSLLAARDVRVVGADTLTSQDVRREAAVPVGTPLARLDTGEVARRVGAMPRVRTVEVGRSWPRTVVITLREREAVAVVREGGEVRGLDAEGVLFRTYVRVPGRLPVVDLDDAGRGREGADALREVARVVGALDPAIARRVDRVRAASMDAITLVLADGDQVRWGSSEASAEKARVLQPLLQVEARVYDVSAPTRPTTRR